jgi:hypothetical protein
MTIGPMAAGGRAYGAAQRDPLDFEPTPLPAIAAFIAAERDALANHAIWEPAVGDGRVARMLHRAGLHVAATSDIANRAGGAHAVADFLTCPAPAGISAIVTNPPFRHAAAFIERALDHHRLPYLALLLKAQFWHAAGRIALHDRHPPTASLIVTWRLDFRQMGNPVMDCTWFVWDARHRGIHRHQLLPFPAVMP